MTTFATADIRNLRRNKATRAAFLARAAYYDNAADRLEAEYARDLAEWEAGTPARPDLADPRKQSVANVRALAVKAYRDDAYALRLAAPTE